MECFDCSQNQQHAKVQENSSAKLAYASTQGFDAIKSFTAMTNPMRSTVRKVNFKINF